VTADRQLVIIGAGDHGIVVLDLALATGQRVLGFVDPRPGRQSGQVVANGVTLVGDLESPSWLRDPEAIAFVVAVGDNAKRAAAFHRSMELGMQPVSLVHPSAILLGGVDIGRGVQVCAGVTIGVEAAIFDNSIVNTAATIDHHNRIGPNAFIGPGANLSGRVTVEEGAWVGIGATVREGSIIGRDSYVAAGAVVIGNVAAGSRVAGVPATPMDGPGPSEEDR